MDVEMLFLEVGRVLREARRILLIAHQKPDGDTLGSSSSVLNWLRREGKDVTIFCLDKPPAAFSYLDSIELYTSDPAVFDVKYDVVVVFDSGDLRYCGVDTLFSRLPPGYRLINLDHHATNTRFAAVNIVLTEASSTAEVVYRFYAANEIRMDAAMATSLLTGLVTDTSSFTNPATTRKSLEAASHLLRIGARYSDLLTSIWHDKQIDSLKIWGLLLSRLHHQEAYDVVSTYLKLEDGKEIGTDIIEGVANFLCATLATADTVLFLRELPGGMVKGSLRSVGRDISKVAQLLGGGGHKLASGFKVPGRLEIMAEGVCIVD